MGRSYVFKPATRANVQSCNPEFKCRRSSQAKLLHASTIHRSHARGSRVRCRSQPRHGPLKLERPLFLEGEPGVGKTEIVKVLAQMLGTRLIRLQCYEGLDVSSAVYEWDYTDSVKSLHLFLRINCVQRGIRIGSYAPQGG